MYNIKISGFKFLIGETSIELVSDVYGADVNALAETLLHVQLNHKALLAAANLYWMHKRLDTGIEHYRNHKYLDTEFVQFIRWFVRSDEGRSQLELWCSYFYEQCVLQPTDEVLMLHDRLEEADTLLRRYEEYLRFKDLYWKYPDPHTGYVYLFQLSTGHYKIGFSNNPQRRGREITSGLPFSIELLHQIQSNQIACLEHELHVRYADKRHGDTEWFSLTPEEVLEIKAMPDCTYPWVGNADWDFEFRRETPKPTLPQHN